jgi:hypothetical protein
LKQHLKKERKKESKQANLLKLHLKKERKQASKSLETAFEERKKASKSLETAFLLLQRNNFSESVTFPYGRFCNRTLL